MTLDLLEGCTVRSRSVLLKHCPVILVLGSWSCFTAVSQAAEISKDFCCSCTHAKLHTGPPAQTHTRPSAGTKGKQGHTAPALPARCERSSACWHAAPGAHGAVFWNASGQPLCLAKEKLAFSSQNSLPSPVCPWHHETYPDCHTAGNAPVFPSSLITHTKISPSKFTCISHIPLASHINR